MSKQLDRIADDWDEEPFLPCVACPCVDDCHMMGECQGFDEEDEEP